jgi:hypothetical protein
MLSPELVISLVTISSHSWYNLMLQVKSPLNTPWRERALSRANFLTGIEESLCGGISMLLGEPPPNIPSRECCSLEPVISLAHENYS